jgi:Fe-S cluster assembly protein SufB
VIFEDMAKAVHTHEALVKKYFMKLVPAHDHIFAALHGAVWSGGTFIHIPHGVHVTEPLQAYFRMNTLGGGQFEHTLIVVEDDAVGDYIE